MVSAEQSGTDAIRDFGTAMGLVAALLFLTWRVVPLPEPVVLLAHVLFGPLAVAGFLGLQVALRSASAGANAMLIIARTWGIIAACLFTAMTLVQSSSVILHAGGIDGVARASAAREWQAMFRGITSVQHGLDLAWEVYVLLGMILFASVMVLRPGASRLLGVVGMVVGSATLACSLVVFLMPPLKVGLIDSGPVAAGWFLVVSMWALFSCRLAPRPTTALSCPLSLQE